MPDNQKRSVSNRLGGLAASFAIRSWMSTCDFQGAYYDPTVDPVRTDFAGPVIAIFWHEYLLVPFYLRGRSGSAILTSQHRDADWLSEAARHMGFETIRGSTYRGGSRALLKLMRSRGTRNLGIACDGPRGPRRHLAQGPVYLSSRLQIPLITYGIGVDRCWRMASWDQFAVPRPGARIRLIMGPRMQIPRDIRRDGVEHYRLHVQDVLLRLTWEAEAWAASGTRKVGQTPLVRKPASRRAA